MNGIILALALNALLLGLFEDQNGKIIPIGFQPKSACFKEIRHAPARIREIRIVDPTAHLHPRLFHANLCHTDGKAILVLEGQPRSDVQRTVAHGETYSAAFYLRKRVTVERPNFHDALNLTRGCLAAIFDANINAEISAIFSPTHGNLDVLNREVGPQLPTRSVGKSLVRLSRRVEGHRDVNNTSNCDYNCDNRRPKHALGPQGHLLLSAKVLLGALIFAGGMFYSVRSLFYAANADRIGANVIGGVGVLIGALICAGALALLIY